MGACLTDAPQASSTAFPTAGATPFIGISATALTPKGCDGSTVSTKIACICGIDDRYQGAGKETSWALKNSGATRILVAGKPDDRLRELEKAGVDQFVYVGCDVHALLEALLTEVGARPKGVE